jgi:hypothetical protein
VTYFIVVRFKEMLVSAPVGGEILAPKHVVAMQKIVHIDNRTVHLLVLHDLSFS